ncbi:MAG: hypothetical protein V3V31_01460 [Methylococcales bacterium]
MEFRHKLIEIVLIFIFFWLLTGCATAPSNPGNICTIFSEKDDWYDDAMDSYEKWGIPVPVQMAIIHQESRFRSDAQPPRKRFLGFIPTFRPSTAYGYPQALDSTWAQYIEETGNSGADRDDFEDATDFVGWYGTVSHRKLRISKADAYRQYLAYHEGQSGYRRRSYNKKQWLMKIARKVDRRAKTYRKQIARCKDGMERSWW